MKEDARQSKINSLKEKIEQASGSINNQLGDYKEKGQNALIIGGILVAAYALVRVFSEDDEEEETEELAKKATPAKPVKDESPSVLGATLKGLATTVLLGVIKSKVEDYIADYTTKDEK
jgi:hypothetical protein